MKFPICMLRDYVETRLGAEELGDLLTMAGFELEGTEETLGETVFDIKVTANRGDGLSVFGLAREVLAKEPNAKPTALYEAARDSRGPGRLTPTLEGKVSIEAPDCNRFAALVIENVRNGASPGWMQDRLAKAGMRPISLLVDVSNYVMLEQGHPTHAFDLDKLHGEKIVIRHAKSGEKLTTLNGEEHELEAGMMMVCDGDRPVGAPGIMGGLDTEVSDATTRALIECAHFRNTTVRKMRKQMGLSTEASYRFERSVDPEGVLRALRRVEQLLSEAGSNHRILGLQDVYPTPPTQVSFEVSLGRACALLGMDVSAGEAKGYLERLGFVASGGGEPFTVRVPTWRPDVLREEDVVEELGRIHGYERIPERLPSGATHPGGVRGFELFVDQLRASVVRVGFIEIVSHSLWGSHPLDEPGERVKLRNPVTPDLPFLRNSLQPCLAEATHRNLSDGLSLFEIGRCHVADGKGRREEIRLGLLAVGALAPPSWCNCGSRASFFSLKGAIEGALWDVGVSCEFRLPRSEDPRFHPTRQASIWAGDAHLGLVGEIHPEVAEASSLPVGTVLAELACKPLHEASQSHELKLRALSRNPAVRRDVAILIEKTVPYAAIAAAIAEAGGAELEKQWLFDVYEGKGVPERKHSLAIALQFRKAAANLTDEEANGLRDRVVLAINALGGVQR